MKSALGGVIQRKTWWGRKAVLREYCIDSQSRRTYGLGAAQPFPGLVVLSIFIHVPDDGTERIYRWQPAGRDCQEFGGQD